jgi:hypothetical protein
MKLKNNQMLDKGNHIIRFNCCLKGGGKEEIKSLNMRINEVIEMLTKLRNANELRLDFVNRMAIDFIEIEET